MKKIFKDWTKFERKTRRKKMKCCMIETAFDNLDEAREVIEKLLQEKLVASCQMVESNSKWIWKKELEESKEYLVFMKTKKTLQEKIYKVIKDIHSYECFEFAVFDLESCNKDYLNWIEEELYE